MYRKILNDRKIKGGNKMILKHLWFSQLTHKGTIGIVISKDDITGEINSYIGVGEGQSLSVDLENILNYGSPINIPMLNAEYNSIVKEDA